MAYRTISIETDAPVKEALADAAITPGWLLERTATGVKAHATRGGLAQRLFAIEDENQGKEIGDDYTSANRVFFKNFQPGDVVYALIQDEQNIAIGDMLVSGGDGTLAELQSDSSAVGQAEQDVVGVALEAVDLSGSSGEGQGGSQRCLVEVR